MTSTPSGARHQNRAVARRCGDMKLKKVAKGAISRTPVSRPRIRRRPAPAASEAIAAASTRALYAGLVVNRTMNRHAADQAATALAFKRSLLLGRWGRSRRRVRRLDVMPTQRVLVLQHRVGVPALRLRPLAARFDEQRPIGLVLWKALAVLRGFVVDLAYRGTKAEFLELVLDAGLVHQVLAVDRVGAEPDARLNRGAGQVLDHDICVARRGGVHAWRGGGCSGRPRRPATGSDRGRDCQNQCRAGPDEVLSHVVSSRRSAFPNAPVKADRQELPCRCARAGLRRERSRLLPRGSPP